MIVIKHNRIGCIGANNNFNNRGNGYAQSHTAIDAQRIFLPTQIARPTQREYNGNKMYQTTILEIADTSP